MLDPQVDLREPLILARLPLTALAPGHTPPPFDGRDGSTRVRVEVSAADSGQPVATRKQADVVLWATSSLTRQFNRNANPLPTIATSSKAILRFLGRDEGGAQRAWLNQALLACTNTVVSLEAFGDRTHTHCFRLLDGIDVGARGDLAVHAGDWLLQAVHDHRVLRLDPAVLRLSPVERRLYSFARSKVGKRRGDAFAIPYWEAYDRSGSSDEPRKFRAALLAAIRRDALPGFTVAAHGRGPGLELVVQRRTTPVAAQLDGITLDIDLPPDEPNPPAELIHLPDFAFDPDDEEICEITLEYHT